MIDNTVLFQILKNLGRNKKGSEIAQDLFFCKEGRYVKEDFRKGVPNKDYPFRLCMWPSFKKWHEYAEGDDLYASYCKERKEKQPFHDKEYPLVYCFSSHAYHTLLDYALNRRAASDACNEILKTLKNMRVSDDEQDYARKIVHANENKESSLQELVFFLVESAEEAADRETASRETQLSICQRLEKEEKSGTKNDISFVAEAKELTSLPKNDISPLINTPTDTKINNAYAYQIHTSSSLIGEGFSERALAHCLRELYSEQLCAARQPMSSSLESLDTWIRMLQDASNTFLFITDPYSFPQGDTSKNDGNSTMAPIGFLWAKRCYTNGSLDSIRWEEMLSPEDNPAPANSCSNTLCIIGNILPEPPERTPLVQQLLSSAVFHEMEGYGGLSHVLALALSGKEEGFWREVGFTPLGEYMGTVQCTPLVPWIDAHCEAVYGVIMGMCVDFIPSPTSDLTVYDLFHRRESSYLLTSTATGIKFVLESLGYSVENSEAKSLSTSGRSSIKLSVGKDELRTKVKLSDFSEMISIHIVSESGPYEAASRKQIDSIIAKKNFALKDQTILREGDESFHVSYRSDSFSDSPLPLEALRTLLQRHFDMATNAHKEISLL